MSHHQAQVECTPSNSQQADTRATSQRLQSKRAALTDAITVYRILPQKERRMVGPFCFLDHFGPTATDKPIDFDVPPHPHTGLQTLSWLWSGEILHLDSLGSEQWLKPGQVNLMTSGRGISHAEVIPKDFTQHAPLHGSQIWLALPPDQQDVPADFSHHSNSPELKLGDFQGHLILGEFANQQAPARVRHPAVAFDLKSEQATAAAMLALNPEFEYLIYVVEGEAEALGQGLEKHEGLYLAPGLHEVSLSGATQVLVLGGVPFAKPMRMFWNFVALDNETLYEAAHAWNNQDERFGKVSHYQGEGPEWLKSPLPPESMKG
ncbi:MAG: pirin family protein [Idiomarina sp.]|nr:pirin family protein [Idiomarina sp.]